MFFMFFDETQVIFWKFKITVIKGLEKFYSTNVK